ncbi:MAG: (deoxy)nucleoside triphosphate pyrophosphohydrolase [Gammaproteobacteria bacterium]|nr:(deoxy)nucleoside triphosphate pyrophosphohydrolase [Gammaproteobacteria bacterium]
MTVAIGLVRGAGGDVLLSRRKPGDTHAGRWEFPGGKLRAGEDAASALKRELREELSLEVTAARHCFTAQHDYGGYAVRLEVFAVERYQGRARGAEGQELRWARPEELAAVDLLEGSRPVAEFLQRGGLR